MVPSFLEGVLRTELLGRFVGRAWEAAALCLGAGAHPTDGTASEITWVGNAGAERGSCEAGNTSGMSLQATSAESSGEAGNRLALSFVTGP